MVSNTSLHKHNPSMVFSLALRLKSVFLPSARRAQPPSPQPAPGQIQPFATTAVELANTADNASPASAPPRASTVGSSTVHFSDADAADSGRAKKGTTKRPRARSVDIPPPGSGVPHSPRGSRARAPSFSSGSPPGSALSAVRVPTIPGVSRFCNHVSFLRSRQISLWCQWSPTPCGPSIPCHSFWRFCGDSALLGPVSFAFDWAF